jgi:hypothetical protein
LFTNLKAITNKSMNLTTVFFEHSLVRNQTPTAIILIRIFTVDGF